VAPRFRLRTGRTEVIPVPGTRNLLLPVPKSSRFPVPTPFRGSGWEPGTPMGRPRFRNHDGNHVEPGTRSAMRALRVGPGWDWREGNPLAPPGETPASAAPSALSPGRHRCQPEPPGVRPTRAVRPRRRWSEAVDLATSSLPRRQPRGLGAGMFDPGVFPRRSLPPSVPLLSGGDPSGPMPGPVLEREFA